MVMLPFLAWILLILVLWAIAYGIYSASRSTGRRLFSRLSARASESGALTSRLPEPWRKRAPYIKIGLFVAVGAILALVTGDWFVDIAEAVRANSHAAQLVDQTARDWAFTHRREVLLPFVLLVTIIGKPLGLSLIAAGAALFALARHRRDLAIFMVLTAAGGGILNQILKSWFKRARPDLALALSDAPGYSFPSGHTMGSMIILGAIVWIAVILAKTQAAKSLAVAIGIASILAISSSRIYLGVHWFTDVAAGLAAGLLWLVIAITGWEAWRRIHVTRAAARAARTSKG